MAAKILYVEDHPAQREMIAQMLEWGGYAVEVAGDGLEGVEKALSELPDLILMDLRMPRMDGFAAIKAIRGRAETAHIPIIAMSSLTGERYKQRALTAGADEHFMKPIDLNQLIPAIKVHLAKSQSG